MIDKVPAYRRDTIRALAGGRLAEFKSFENPDNLTGDPDVGSYRDLKRVIQEDPVSAVTITLEYIGNPEDDSGHSLIQKVKALSNVRSFILPSSEEEDLKPAPE